MLGFLVAKGSRVVPGNNFGASRGEARMRVLAIILLLIPQLAAAKVYMCVDAATGTTSFTDTACDRETRVEEVRVDATNLESGERYKKAPREKTWNSEREVRKSGQDYNAEYRSLYDNSATARRN